MENRFGIDKQMTWLRRHKKSRKTHGFLRAKVSVDFETTYSPLR